MTKKTLSLGDAGALHVTPSAEQFMKRMVRFGGHGASGHFRLVVKPGGCSGLSSSFTIEPAAAEGDELFALEGLRLLVPRETFAALSAVTIDFVDAPTQAGLIFIDPKPSSCATTAPAKQELVGLGTWPQRPS